MGYFKSDLALLISVVESSFFFKWKLDLELWGTSQTFRVLSRAVFSKNRNNRFVLLRGKIGPENRVNIFLSYKSGIKKPENSIGLYVINYGFNFFIWIIVIAHFKKLCNSSSTTSCQHSPVYRAHIMTQKLPMEPKYFLLTLISHH